MSNEYNLRKADGGYVFFGANVRLSLSNVR